MSKSLLIMMRHGESEWNKMNIFQGWVDIPLSSKGIEEALEAGRKIAHISFDVIFVTSLIRTQMSALLAMTQNHEKKIPVVLHPEEGLLEEWSKIYSEEAKNNCIPVIKAWQLNERMYGQLQGLNKEETAKKYGAEQVKIWRRSYDVCPPKGESLAMTTQRVIPYFKEFVIPYLEQGKKVLIVAHGNSIRSIIKYIDNLSDSEIINLEIATGLPIHYKYEKGKWSQ